jgi:hypothetical protein
VENPAEIPGNPPAVGPDYAPNWPASYDTAIRDSVSQTQLNFSASKVGDVCPKWGSLSADQKKDLWVAIWWAIAKPESGYNPKAMFWEKTMPNDEVTGQLTTSEGLLQLSYQDSPWAKCGFDYAADKAMHLDDLSRRPTGKQSWKSVHDKTINDPIRNLVCANKIMTYYATNVSAFRNYSLTQLLSDYFATFRDEKASIMVDVKKRAEFCF